jgi:hypothetical protein
MIISEFKELNLGTNEFNELPSQYDVFGFMGELYFDMNFET